MPWWSMAIPQHAHTYAPVHLLREARLQASDLRCQLRNARLLYQTKTLLLISSGREAKPSRRAPATHTWLA